MDNPAPLMHVDWIRWFQSLADAITAPITGISPSQITMPTGLLLGRTSPGIGAAETISVTAPLTLSAGALGITGSALTRVDDTNVTLTLTGSPTTALLAATGLTLGWTGVLSPARGGTGTSSATTDAPLVLLDEDNEALWARAAIGQAVTGRDGATGPQGPSGLDGAETGDDPWAFAAASAPGFGPFTAGSVIFAGPGGLLAQDNANLFWDDTLNNLKVGTPSLALTGTDGVVIRNDTAATAGVTVQIAPRLRFRANVWNSTAGGTNNTQDWFMDVRPTTAATPTGEWRMGTSFNGGTERVNVLRLTVSSDNTQPKSFILNCDDNTSGNSHARLVASSGGASGGDPLLQLGISGAGNWSVGMDNDDSDKFKIGANVLVGTSTALTIDATTLNVGLQVASPTATLHLKAGTTAASTAPLKLTSGTNMTTAEAGAAEYDGTNLFFTRAGTVRENVLVAIDNVAAPATNAGTPTTRYGGNTNYLGDPNRWLSVNILGSTYRIALYT